MTRNEYEQRKRRLEEQLWEGMELLQAAYRQQVRALELVWTTTAEDAEVLPRALAVERGPESPAVVQGRSPVPAESPRPRRREPGKLLADVSAALADVPEVFDHQDVRRTLGYEPDRSSLYRVLMELVEAGVIALQSRGDGRVPTKYRKAGA